IDENQPFRRHDLAIDEPAPHGGAIRRLHAVEIGPAHPQIHFRSDYDETLRPPPLLHALRVGEALPHQLARRIEHTRDDKVRAFRRDHGHSYSIGVAGLIWIAASPRAAE